MNLSVNLYRCSVGARQFSSLAPQFPMRSLHFPKNSRACLEKTANLNPDVIVLDLEDSVKPSEKPSVRKMYRKALKDRVLDKFKVFIRSSSLDDKDDVLEDIDTFVGSGITGFLLPKVETPTSVSEIDELIGRVEKEKGISFPHHKLIPIAETPAAYFSLDKIASVSDRNIAIIAGSGDFTADTVCNDHSLAYDAFFSKAVLAARAAGIGAIWGVFDKIDDHIGFEEICLKMKRTGYNGMATLTPKQITLANYFYSISHRETEWADKVLSGVDSHGESLKMLRLSIQESRQMIGPPHRKKAENMKKLFQLSLPAKEAVAACNTDGVVTIKGTKPEKGMSSCVSIGEIIHTPNKILVGESLKTLWCSLFPCGGNGLDKLHELMQTPRQLPFNLATVLAVALSVSTLSYHARVHLAFKNVFQYRPLLTGDTIRAIYRIDEVKSKKGGDSTQYSVIYSTHWLINQANEIVLQLEKVTMFSPNDCKLHIKKVKHTKTLMSNESLILKSIIESSSISNQLLPPRSQPSLESGQLLFHDLVKVMGHSETRMLCTLLGIVNPHHHNQVRFSHRDLLVPGPFVMSAGVANTTLDLGEVLYEDIPQCTNPNKVNFGDQIGTLTYITQCKEIEGNPDLQEVLLKHIVVKNSDMEILSQLEIPIELLEADKMKPSQIEAICADNCPILLHKIACVIVRRIIRVRPSLYLTSQIPQELTN